MPDTVHLLLGRNTLRRNCHPCVFPNFQVKSLNELQAEDHFLTSPSLLCPLIILSTVDKRAVALSTLKTMRSLVKFPCLTGERDPGSCPSIFQPRVEE